MSITLLPVADWAGTYNTSTQWWGGYYSPLVVYPNGRVTIVGQEIVYSYNSSTKQLTFDWQNLSGSVAKGTIIFSGSGNSKTFSGTINPRPVDGPVSFTGTQAGSPLACWTGSYDATAVPFGPAFSPFVVHPTGELTIAKNRVEYQYDITTDTLIFEPTQIGSDTISGAVTFSDTGAAPTFSGMLTTASNNQQYAYTGAHKGMPLSYWAEYYNTSTHWWGGFFSPLIIHNNDTLDIAGQRLNFDYDSLTNRLTFDWQDIKDTKAKGDIVFSSNGTLFNFSGSINPRPQDGPVSFSGQTGNIYEITMKNNRSRNVSVYAMSAAGEYTLIGSLVAGASITYSSYQGQHFLAKEGQEVFSGFYTYPGLTEWNLNTITDSDELLPSLGSKTAAPFNVINHLSTYLEIYKINEDSEIVFQTIIPAKRQYVVESNENDHWIVAQQGRVIDQFYGSTSDKHWVVDATSHPAFGIDIPADGNLTAPNIAGYNVGLGDFTVISMVQPKIGGTIISKKGTAGGAGNGGFLVVVKPDGTIKFATDDGSRFYEVNSVATDILNGECHSVAAVRQSGGLSIYLDGEPLSVTPRTNSTTPLNINNGLPLMLGGTEQQQEPHNQYSGLLMNAGFWNRALSKNEISVAQFGRVTEVANGLQGFWTLNYNLEDLSANKNRLTTNGNVAFASCFNCIWAYGQNSYVFCQMENPQNNLIDVQQVSRKRIMSVPAGSPSLIASIFDNSINFSTAKNVVLKITAPDGTVYNTETNTESLYVHMEEESLAALAVTNPVAGDYTIEITGHSNAPFTFQLQTAPSTDVVNTTLSTLGPLFPTPSAPVRHRALMARNMEFLSLGGFWSMLAAVVAVVAITAVVAVVVVASGGTALAAAGAAAATLAITGQAANMYMLSQSDNKHIANGQAQGTGGYISTTRSILLIDANVEADPATQEIYKVRKDVLYPYVNSSKYQDHQASLIGIDDTKTKVTSALQVTSATYCTASGHGRPSYLMGWYANGTDGPLQEVMNSKTTNAEASNKIIHIFGCHCGYEGAIGLGQMFVTKGTKAFFGYNEAYQLSVKTAGITKKFCQCDIEIDLQLLDGKDADTAYNRSFAKYSYWVKQFRENGNPDVAVLLENDMNRLVSPTTNEAYGDKTAKLE